MSGFSSAWGASPTQVALMSMSHAGMATVPSQGMYPAAQGVFSAMTRARSSPRSRLRLMTVMCFAPASAHSTPMALPAPPAPSRTMFFPSMGAPCICMASTKPLPSVFSPM